MISLGKNGKAMMHAYSEIYLEDAMQNLAVMLDYGTLKEGNSEAFFDRFLSSGIAEEFGKNNPKFVVGMSGIELAETVFQRTGTNSEIVEYCPEGRSAEYWAGWVLAYLQWYTALTFDKIKKKGITLPYLLSLYPTYHEADISKFLDTALKKMSEHDRNNISPLKRQRLVCALTQKELAYRTGISLRMIRAYEQKRQDISKAEVRSVINLAKALSCKVEDLI